MGKQSRINIECAQIAEARRAGGTDESKSSALLPLTRWSHFSDSQSRRRLRTGVINRRNAYVMTALGTAAMVVPSSVFTPVATADPIPTGATLRVSVAVAGGTANAQSHTADLSANGRFVVFSSSASNLVAGDTNKTDDIFVRDRSTGVTSRVSVSSSERQGNGPSEHPTVSADGRYVAFTSEASNLVAGDTNKSPDVFVRDRLMGTTARASVATGGTQARFGAADAYISADGHVVAFSSGSANLVPGDTNEAGDVFVRDLATGTTARVNVATTGAQSDSDTEFPDGAGGISGDGRFVVFGSFAANLVAGDTNGVNDLFVRDRVAGTTTRVSVASSGAQADAHSRSGSISADGRFVVFDSGAENLDPRDTNRNSDVFVHDRESGTTTGVSVVPSDSPNQGPPSWAPNISADGRYVVFTSEGSFPPEDINESASVFLHDRSTNSTTRVSVSSTGAPANNYAEHPSVSANGRHVLFSSAASNLVPGPRNDSDLYVRDRLAPANPFGDFDGDQLSDLIVRRSSTGELFLYRGTGTGVTSRTLIGRSGWNGMNVITRLGDFDGDAHEDVITRETSTGKLWLYRGTGTGFSSRVRLGNGSWTSMREITAVGDLDGDTEPDLVAVETPTGNLFLYPGNRASIGARRLIGRGGWNGMSELTGVGDFNRDGFNDLIARQHSTGELWLYPGTATGTSLAARTRLGASGWNGMRDLVGVGDYDRDGYNDLTAVQGSNQQLYLYVGRGSSMPLRQPLGTGWTGTFRPVA
jgi:Tol biopolymer transport system component